MSCNFAAVAAALVMLHVHVQLYALAYTFCKTFSFVSSILSLKP